MDNAYADTVKLADSIQKVTQMKKNSKKVDNKDEQVDDKIIGRDGNVNDEDADKAKNVKSRKNKKKKVQFRCYYSFEILKITTYIIGILVFFSGKTTIT